MEAQRVIPEVEYRTLNRCKDELEALAGVVTNPVFRDPAVEAPAHFPVDGSVLGGCTIVSTEKYQRYQKIAREWVQIKAAYKFNMKMVEDLRTVYLKYQEGQMSERDFFSYIVNIGEKVMANNPGVQI